MCLAFPRSTSLGCKEITLTYWGRMTHICVSKQTIIGSDNDLSPDRRQAIIWTNAGLLLIWPLRTNFSEILIEILTFSFKKMRLKVSSAKRRPFCLGLNVLNRTNEWQIGIRSRYVIRDLGDVFGFVGEHGMWQGSISTVMDGVNDTQYDIKLINGWILCWCQYSYLIVA